MSYFVLIGSPGERADNITLPAHLKLVAANQAQQYVRNCIPLCLPESVLDPRGSVYLLTYETGDTSHNVVSEIQIEVNLNGVPFQDTRLGKCLSIASEQDWVVCVWWAGMESQILWFADMTAFSEHLTTQMLCCGGDFAAGYQPS